MSSWVKLHRKILDAKIFASPSDLKIWIWLTCRASFDTRYLTLKVGATTRIVTLERGQLIFGRLSASRELKMDDSLVYRAVKRMEQDGIISIQSNNHFSIITMLDYIEDQENGSIENYEVIEECTAGEQPVNSTRTADAQPVHNGRTQYKKVKNVKKVKNLENDTAGAECPPEVSPEFKTFWDWTMANAPRVHKMREPFTEKQFTELKKEWPAVKIADFLKQMHNWEPLVRKNRSAYLTIENWLKKDRKNEINRTTAAGSNGKTGTSTSRVEALRKW